MRKSKVIALKYEMKKACEQAGKEYDKKYFRRAKKIYLSTPRTERQDFSLLERRSARKLHQG